MSRNFFLSVFVVGLGLVMSLPARAADGFGKLPTADGGKSSPLLIRILRYQGGTNGAITVDIKNPTSEPQGFSAKGLYFVPRSNANEAPQRLGAVGPFLLLGAGRHERRDGMTIDAGATERLSIDVYCIDSHRASPGAATSFRIAKDRVPAALSRAIEADVHQAARPYGGVSAAPARSAVQSEVWKNRDKKWIELDGEGAQEQLKRHR